jgi:phage tail tape-measure protein
MIVDELIAILGYDVKGDKELDRFNRGLDNAERKAQAVANRINAMSVAIGTFVGKIAAQGAMRLGSMIGSLPGDVLAVGREFENLETVLTTIEGSSDKAREAMGWVENFAKTTPYDLNQVSEAFVRMRAYGLDPMSGQLKTVGDAAAGMG